MIDNSILIVLLVAFICFIGISGLIKYGLDRDLNIKRNKRILLNHIPLFKKGDILSRLESRNRYDNPIRKIEIQGIGQDAFNVWNYTYKDLDTSEVGIQTCYYVDKNFEKS